ncbi:MAG: sulfatase [Myxococcales bacterium]|nr:sulfatase [Myxococcales bacterium]
MAILLLVFVIAVIALTLFEHRVGGDWDSRPVGDAEDVAALANRDDVNVLFILIDTMRAERLGSYGYERDTSPVIDRLAASGIRFERHLAQSTWTKTSMASLWTGLLPTHTGISRFDHVIPEAANMAVEVFRNAGFLTVGLYRNGWVAPTFGFDQGFAIYQRPGPAPMAPGIRRENPTVSDRSTDEGIFEAAVEFLRVNANERFFLYIHLMDLHEYIYDEHSALFGSSYSDVYDNSIRWTDDSIGIMLERLGMLGLLDKTVIAIASDHGEAFLERGFEGHARRVFRETTEVPFLISLPFRLEPGVEVKTRTANVDIWPTIFELLGLESPTEIDGRSRMPDIAAELSGIPLDDKVRVSIADLDQNWAKRDSEPLPTIAVVEGPYRYVRVAHEGEEEATEVLFDAREDPLERVDQSEAEPETLARMRAAADEYRAQQPSWGDSPTRELGELELNLLRALGYQVE